MINLRSSLRLLIAGLLSVCFVGSASASERSDEIAAKMDTLLEPVKEILNAVIFVTVPIGESNVPAVLILLAGTAMFLTVYFKFLNVRALGLAFKTVKGKYSEADDPGQITHFQALTTALSATVGLGNIAGVALAIGLGGPGAVLWMIVMGVLGMTSKFTECTLGVRYRQIGEDGRAHGGGMFYLRDGLKERGLGWLGKILAIVFALGCIGGAIGAGNMFQINQAHQQVSETFGIFDGPGGAWQFGAIIAVLVGMVIIGGIKAIARVTEVLVPFMCLTYVLACFVVLFTHAGDVPAAFATIVSEAFSPSAAVGGFIGGLIQGVQRGVFSNEAGVGSAAIAHAAVKTRRPASEGVVALLEPLMDTVIVCTMTALVIVVTGMWKVDADIDKEVALMQSPALEQTTGITLAPGTQLKVLEKEEKPDGAAKDWAPAWAKVKVRDTEQTGYVATKDYLDRSDTAGGIWMTSKAFEGVIGWFPYVLAIAVFLFAFSTMISWSYYGGQAIGYIFGENRVVINIYKVIFCGFVVVGATASLGNVLAISDALFFAMVVPNLIGVYLLLPVVKEELKKFRDHAARIDRGDA
ncbi:alanine/glycine:cation symporter family protein [Sulfuriroseicoccus oceanibius]|uniref:Alanine:cation symporter family protein n=1 Tax=Sulfuriroseicoccus oceanibius TaxID=2707525 RepID=A0A6B3L638_9BACT|nr:alanine/glycine:cation symporter family protein [Sulfuriroseicoccus oceanibius]QQL45909.1 alanine:cation symporter family protein [Sulfuriroseicoccus oceanibius]